MFLKKIFFNFVLVFFLCFTLPAQETNVPERTAEQEAARQTERLHQEVNLTPEQEKKVYDINLKYARERNVNISRRESLERSKAKEHELMQVLTPEQNSRLQEKRVERSVYQSVIGTRAATPNNAETAPASNVRTDRQYQSPGAVRSDFRQSENNNSRYSSTNDDGDRPARQATPTRSTYPTSTPATTRSASTSTERSATYSRPTESNTTRSAAPTTRPTTPQYDDNRSGVPTTRQQPSSSSTRSASTPSSNSNNTRSSSSSNQNNNETRSSSTQRSSSTSR